MKKFYFTLSLFLTISCLPGCGTLGGALSGAGDDLKKAGEWVSRI